MRRFVFLRLDFVAGVEQSEVFGCDGDQEHVLYCSQ